MKIALISDVHANRTALEALAPELRAADRVLCLGDIIGYYCDVNEVIDFLRDLNAQCVLGNHDYYVLNACPPEVPPAVHFGVAFAKEKLLARHKEWLANLPWVWGGTLAGRSVLLTHGSPWRPMEDYLYANSPKLPKMNDFEFDLVAFGQTHRYLHSGTAKPLLLNPGSVGQNRDSGQHAVASAVIMDTESMTVEQLRRTYDPAPVIASARQAGAGDWITRHLIAETTA